MPVSNMPVTWASCSADLLLDFTTKIVIGVTFQISYLTNQKIRKEKRIFNAGSMSKHVLCFESRLKELLSKNYLILVI